MILIVVEGDPLPLKRHRNSNSVKWGFSPKSASGYSVLAKSRMYDPSKADKMNFAAEARRQYSGPPLNVALWVDMFFYIPIPKSTSKKTRELMLAGKIRPEVKPDRSNVEKFVEDALNGILWRDDAIIVDGRIAKFYSEQPRTELRVSAINEIE
jgi:Holliday junction resolvase RusA-like endonuclease